MSKCNIKVTFTPATKCAKNRGMEPYMFKIQLIMKTHWSINDADRGMQAILKEELLYERRTVKKIM